VRLLREINNWLERRAGWQFVAAYGASLFLLLVIVTGALQWVTKGHFDLEYLLGYTSVFTVMTTAGAALARRQRQRRQRSAAPRVPGQ
jgi:hypothetical protein